MFIDLIRSRRSIRRYRQKPVEQEKIDHLVEAALRAMSGHGRQAWELVVVTDPAVIEALSKAKPRGSSFLKDAPLAMAVCGDPAKSDIWIEDASIAATFIHLAAADLGLGSCWIQMRQREHSDGKNAGRYVAEVLGLRDGLEAQAVLAIGYAAEEKEPHAAETLDYGKVSRDRYGRKA
jgi:nitroreductase